MPIDPNIALGYRGIEVPNPLAGMAPSLQAGRAAPSISTFFLSRSKRSMPSPRQKKESVLAVRRAHETL